MVWCQGQQVKMAPFTTGECSKMAPLLPEKIIFNKENNDKMLIDHVNNPKGTFVLCSKQPSSSSHNASVPWKDRVNF